MTDQQLAARRAEAIENREWRHGPWMRHCWFRLRRHEWRITRRKVRANTITESYQCIKCGWPTMKIFRTL